MIVSGRGVLLHDQKRDPFEAGDLLFVAAGVEHQFLEHTADLTVWRVFYGPAGGEAARDVERSWTETRVQHGETEQRRSRVKSVQNV